MVGVAGKSKGCKTCRRRKIKCDEVKPTCQKCEQSKLKCEGYQRYPVFIDRTQSGLRRRKPLEETKTPFSFKPAPLPSPDIEAAGLISWFWHSFAISPPSKHTLLSPSHWLDHFWSGLSYSSCPALWSAFLAVSVTKLAKVMHRHDILLRGRKLYADALVQVRKALDDSKMAMKDELLATAGVMGLYELLDSTSADFGGWLGHLSGLSQLVQYRGPKSLTNPAARAVFEHFRYLVMLQHLLARKASVFGQQEWVKEPWRNTEKPVEQQVFDHGLQLTILFERCDAAIKDGLDVSEAVQLFNKCTELFESLETLHENHVAPSVVIDVQHRPCHTTNPSPVKTPAALMLSIKSLGIQLGACGSAFQIFRHVIEPSIASLDVDDERSLIIRNIAARTFQMNFNRVRLAKEIILSIAYCLNEPVGAIGAARMIFALQLAVQQFQPVDQEFERCQSMLACLQERTYQFGAIMQSNRLNAARIVLKDTKKLIEDSTGEIRYQWMQMADSGEGKENDENRYYCGVKDQSDQWVWIDHP